MDYNNKVTFNTNLPEVIRQELSTLTNFSDVVKLVAVVKYLAIDWGLKHGISERQIANKMSVSNTRIGQIKKAQNQVFIEKERIEDGERNNK